MKRNIIKESVLDLDSYRPEPQQADVLLNANENPYNLPLDIRQKISEEIENLSFNRYPDPFSTELRETIANEYDLPIDHILVGNGLDEVLSIITNTFISPGDVVITHVPGFSMYGIWSQIAGANVVEVEDTPEQKIDVTEIVNQALRNNAKIIYICSPNNPTGQTINLSELEELLEASPSLIVLDEAYVDFSDETFIDSVLDYDNLMVLRTFSKAYRIPGARCGYAVGPKDLIEAMYKVKAPYNLNSITQKIAQILLENKEDLEPGMDEIKNQREDVFEILDEIDDLTVYPSKSNFLYFKTPKHQDLQQEFLKRDIRLRYYPDDGAFRFTIGSPKENKKVIAAIKDVLNA